MHKSKCRVQDQVKICVVAYETYGNFYTILQNKHPAKASHSELFNSCESECGRHTSKGKCCIKQTNKNTPLFFS